MGSEKSAQEANGVTVESFEDISSQLSNLDAAQKIKITPQQPLQWSFSSTNSVMANGGSLLFRRMPLEFIHNQGHGEHGSLLISNRKETWQGMLVRLPQLERGKAYRVTLWAKLINVDAPSQAKLVLTRVVDGKNTSIELNQTQVTPGEWHKLEGEFTASKQSIDDIVTIHVDMATVSANYLIDDLTIAHSDSPPELIPELTELEPMVANQDRDYLNNGDIESGLDFWSHQGGAINLSSKFAHSGKQSIFITGRTQSWNAPTAAVQGLQDNIQYRVSIFTRLEEGEPAAEMLLTLKRVTSGQTTFVPIGSGQANDSGWVEIFGYFTGSNISQADTVVVYLESTDANVSYYVDTLTIKVVQ